jgi:hypothetical protein
VTESNEYTFADKHKLPSGPWHDEPDKLVWVDEATDLDCMIVRSPLGMLCGYVGVPPEHPNHGKGYWHDEGGPGVGGHGGGPYTHRCEGTICHVPEEGRPHDVWWFGFDCGHYLDYVPAMTLGAWQDARASYKNIDFVRTEVESLARQLAAIEVDGD